MAGMAPRRGGPLQIGPYAEQNPPGTQGWQGDPNVAVVNPGMARPLPPTQTPEPQVLPTSTTTLLQGILTAVRDILAEIRGTNPRGLLYSLQVTVQGIDPMPVTFETPLLSLSLTNDGGGIVQYRLPNSGAVNWIDLRPNEQITFSFTRPVITSVAFRVLAAAGTIRAVGFY